MDFARRQLEKYGWSTGKGLGKHEDGISEALKPKLKRSVTGIGHDAAAEFNEHWWSALYDKAAKNVKVEEKNGKTKTIKTVDSQDFTITNSTWRINKKSNNNSDEGEYSEYFVKKAILSNEGTKFENVSDSDSDDEGKKNVFRMTDEELFAACEGRTAHKGARHGLKAIGKLARIAQQEQILLTQSKYEGYSHAKKIKQQNEEIVEDISLEENQNEKPKNKKKKKKRKRCISNENSNVDIIYEQTEAAVVPLPDSDVQDLKKSKEEEKSKRKIKEADGGKSKKSNKVNLHVIVEVNVDINDNNKESKKKKKRNIQTDIEEVSELRHSDTVKELLESVVPKKKKKKNNM